MNERSPQLGLRYKDLAVLDQLMKSGADLTQPRHVIYYSYAPTESVAQAMCKGGRVTRVLGISPRTASRLP